MSTRLSDLYIKNSHSKGSSASLQTLIKKLVKRKIYDSGDTIHDLSMINQPESNGDFKRKKEILSETISWPRAHEWKDSIRCVGNQFKDDYGRTLILRGVNICGNSKLPTSPNGSTHLSEGFYNHENVSFIGRPFPLNEAKVHFKRLRAWGLTFVRFLVPWEALEHKGPGIYDEEFIEYLIKIIKIGAKYGIKCFIDPHQDTWSRFSGGSGAPGWTFQVIGLDLTTFSETGAAYLQQFASRDQDSLMMWPTNYTKLASASLFTCFFGGNIFAPKTFYKGESVQDYLQRHFIACYQHLAKRLSDSSNVVGFEVMNEPHTGYIGLESLYAWDQLKELRFGFSPSAIQSFLLANGIPQKVDVYVKSWPWPTRKSTTKIFNESRVRAWLPGHECIWKQNGVYDLAKDNATPIHVDHDYFLKTRDGAVVDFNRDCYLPFIKSFARGIKKIKSSFLIFFEPVPGRDCPMWLEDEPLKEGLVYAPHWYDLKALFSKSFDGFVTHDVQGLSKGTKNLFTASYFGIKGAKNNYSGQVKNIIDSGTQNLGLTPCLFGECGIPMDLNDKKAFETGDYTKHNMFLDAVISSMEKNLIHFTLWNYNPINDNLFGDHWNGEDFSIFSPSTSGMSSTLSKVFDSLKKISGGENVPVPMTRSSTSEFSGNHSRAHSSSADDPHLHSRLKRKSVSPNCVTPNEQFEINQFYFDSEVDPIHHVGGRALDAIIRPYAPKISGTPLSMRFDYKKRDFFLCFMSHSHDSIGSKDEIKRYITEIFVPNYQYADGLVRISVSDGVWKYDQEKETIYWMYDTSAKIRSRMHENYIDDEEDLVQLLSMAFFQFYLMIYWCMTHMGFFSHLYDPIPTLENHHWIHIRPSKKS